MIRLILVLMIAVCSSTQGMAQERNSGREQERGDVKKTQALSLEEVPAAAMAAAREAKPSVYFKAAEKVWWQDEPVYRIKGTEFRTDWSVYVNGQGEIAHISSDRRDK